MTFVRLSILSGAIYPSLHTHTSACLAWDSQSLLASPSYTSEMLIPLLIPIRALTWGGTLVAVFGIGVGFAVVLVALRIWTRVKILRKTGADDWTVLVALVWIIFIELVYPYILRRICYLHHSLFQGDLPLTICGNLVTSFLLWRHLSYLPTRSITG